MRMDSFAVMQANSQLVYVLCPFSRYRGNLWYDWTARHIQDRRATNVTHRKLGQ